MSDCPICQHAKLSDIDVDIVEEMPLAKIAWKYHVPATVLQVHRAHGPYTFREWQALRGNSRRNEPEIQGLLDETTDGPLVPETPQDVLKLGLRYVREAVRLAGNDRIAQERIVATLNEALQSEGMGL